MQYATPAGFRTALEQRLQNRSRETGIASDRLRRRVMFERIVARLERRDPGAWVVKGGMAMEVRLADAARLTKDIDLGLRDAVSEASELHDRLISALSAPLDGDRFEMAPEAPTRLELGGGGQVTWRAKVDVRLAGKVWGRVGLDISPRPQELTRTDRMELSNTLGFAGVPPATLEIVDVNRHAAEKLHAMARTYATGESTRPRDFVDLALMVEFGLLSVADLAAAVVNVWQERDGTAPPALLPDLPASWPERYRRYTEEGGLDVPEYDDAYELLRTLWVELALSNEE